MFSPIPSIILLAVLVAARLTGVLDWSWWWITSPGWGYVLVTAIAAFGYIIWHLREVRRATHRKLGLLRERSGL